MDQITEIKKQLETLCPNMELRVNEPMSRHTSFRIGGPASLMALAKNRDEASLCLIAAKKLGVESLVLGKGSNILVGDAGYPGFVIKCCMEELSLMEETILYVGSGASLAQAAVFAMEQGLSGMEFAHGIPGSLGGGVYMNAGAYEGEMSQILLWVDCIKEDGQVERLEGAELGLGYRSSIFQEGGRLILGAALQLKPGNPQEIKALMMELMERRRAKQPLEFPSAGSTFKRPPGHFAGALIEGCGLKGARIGGAQVSDKHAGFVVNTGSATCKDVLALMGLVQEKVWETYSVKLEPEVRLLACQL